MRKYLFIALLFAPLLAVSQPLRWGGGDYILNIDTNWIMTRYRAGVLYVPLGSPATSVEELFTFGFGTGAATDTAVCTATAYYGAFYNRTDTLEITSLDAIMVHGIGTDTLTLQVAWDDSLDGTGLVLLNTTPFPINSIGSGTRDVAFNNAKIPPNRWVWMTSPTVVTGRKPASLYVTISGKRIKV